MTAPERKRPETRTRQGAHGPRAANGPTEGTFTMNDTGPGPALPLSDAHRAFLNEYAISDEVIEAAGVRSVFLHSDLPPLLERHYRRRGAMVVPGIVFPWYPPDGSDPVWELRPDRPPDGCPKYLWSADEPLVISVLPPMRGRVADASVPLVYVEGNKQVLAAVSALGDAPYAVAGLHGCWGWSQDKMPSPELGLIPHEGRDVVIAMDRDRTSNPGVWEAAEGLAAAVRALGARAVRYLALPVRGTNGADDYLSTIPPGDRAAVIARLIRQAPDKPGRRPKPEPGQRDQVPADSTADDPGVPVPADGAALLDAVRAFGCRYVSWPSPHAGAVFALWTAHAHAAGVWESTPRLAVLSPEPGSGKTRALEVAELMTPRPLLCLSPSPASVFRTIELARPTLLIDETDSIFTHHGKDDANEDLRALLNAGHRRGAKVPRVVGVTMEVKLFPVYAPVALAGLGDLPQTLMTRSVVIRMRRRAPGEHVEPFRYRDARELARPLAASLAAWAKHHAPALGAARPAMPPGITDRPADVWEPLLAVADAAGGHWPVTAREACLALAPLAESGEASLGIRLLSDLWDVFNGADAVPTAVILGKLNAMDEAPWGNLGGFPLDARGLARRLKGYGVESRSVRSGGTVGKGYRAADLFDSWTRYVLYSRIGVTSATSATPQVSGPPDVTDAPVTSGTPPVSRPPAVADVTPMRGTGQRTFAGVAPEYEAWLASRNGARDLPPPPGAARIPDGMYWDAASKRYLPYPERREAGDG
jgi:Protein of unknown function (DUF3631)/Domain of unknown function (DUF3854)